MRALDEDFFRPGQRMLPVKEWREAALEFFSEQKPEIEFDVVDSHDKDFPILTIHTSEKRVTLLDGRSYFREGTKNVLLTPQTGRAQDTLEPHRALGDWIADDKILIADANMPVADANFPITSADTRTDVEPKSEQPSKEPITTQAVGESKSTSTAMAVGEAITVGDAVSAAVSGDEEPATKVADDAVGSPRAVGDVSGTSQSVSIGMAIIGHDPRQTSEQSASESERLSVTGRGLPTRWKATLGEECLNIDKYAKVIAALFRAVSETEQLCFGLFGHWGRGKTTMAKKVAAELESGGYQSITFSAWKYRTNPELWIHLYETVVKAAGHSNWFLPIRASFVRIGPWPAIFAIWAFFGALQTIGQSLGSLYSAIQWLGVAGLA